MDTKFDIVNHPEKIHATAFVAPGAVVIGNVTIEAEASLWFGAVVRADTDEIVIGEQTNVQDGCILHVDRGSPCVLGKRVTLGHGAVVHGATIEDDVLIGIKAIVLNGARIGRGSVIAAGALVAPGTIIPPKSLVMGVPGKVVRPANESDALRIKTATEHYCAYAREYAAKYPRS